MDSYGRDIEQEIKISHNSMAVLGSCDATNPQTYSSLKTQEECKHSLRNPSGNLPIAKNNSTKHRKFQCEERKATYEITQSLSYTE